MAYIGKSPGTGVRNRFIYTATAGQTTFSGSDDHSRTLSYTDPEFTDVFLNGVKLDKSDYTATSGTSIVLGSAASVDDILEVLAFDTFSVFSGEFSQDVTVGGTLDMQGGEVILDADGDTSITSDTDDQIDFRVGGDDRMQLFGDASKFAVGTAWEDKTDTSIDNAQFGSYTGGSYGILIKSGSTGSGGLSFADSTTSRTGGIFYQHNTERIEFFVSNAERMRINSDGDVLIGTSTSRGRFTLESSNNGTEHVVRNTNSSLSGTSVAGFQIRASRAANSAYYLLETRSGDITDREHVLRGDGNTFCDGSFTGGGADYAEYFEWDDDNTSNEDRRGFSVVLTSGNKIRKATSSDAAADIIGVISGNPSVVGDAGYLRWDGKYNRDDFGSIIWETHTLTEWTDADGTEHSYHTDRIPSDVTAPADATVVTVDGSGDTLKRRQLNSSYDDTQTYTPREDRQEWDAVGMMGKLRLRAGQPTGDRWIKMRDIATDDDGNVTVEEWLVR